MHWGFPHCAISFIYFFCLWKWLTILLSPFSSEVTKIVCCFSFISHCPLPSFLRAIRSKFPTWLTLKQVILSGEGRLSGQFPPTDAQPAPELSCCLSGLVVFLGVFRESIHFCNKNDHLLPMLIQTTGTVARCLLACFSYRHPRISVAVCFSDKPLSFSHSAIDF